MVCRINPHLPIFWITGYWTWSLWGWHSKQTPRLASCLTFLDPGILHKAPDRTRWALQVPVSYEGLLHLIFLSQDSTESLVQTRRITSLHLVYLLVMYHSWKNWKRVHWSCCVLNQMKSPGWEEFQLRVRNLCPLKLMEKALKSVNCGQCI